MTAHTTAAPQAVIKFVKITNHDPLAEWHEVVYRIHCSEEAGPWLTKALDDVATDLANRPLSDPSESLTYKEVLDMLDHPAFCHRYGLPHGIYAVSIIEEQVDVFLAGDDTAYAGEA